MSFSIPGWGIGILEQAEELIREQQTRSALNQRRTSSRASAPGYLWRRTSPMEEHDSRWVPHRIIRRTGQSVLVEADPFIETDDTVARSRSGRNRAYWMDRAELEQLGFARVRSWKLILFANPQLGDRVMPMVESLTRLGLWFPYSERDVDRAYRRRALTVHPDTGGSEEQFVQLQRDHQRAMQALKVIERCERSGPDDP